MAPATARNLTWGMSALNPSRTVDYFFGAGLAYKDVRLCIDEDKSLGVPMVGASGAATSRPYFLTRRAWYRTRRISTNRAILVQLILRCLTSITTAADLLPRKSANFYFTKAIRLVLFSA